MEIVLYLNGGLLSYVYINGGCFMLEWTVVKLCLYINGGWFMFEWRVTKLRL